MIRISETKIDGVVGKRYNARELNSITYFIDDIMNSDAEKVFFMGELFYCLLRRFSNDEVKARRTTILR